MRPRLSLHIGCENSGLSGFRPVGEAPVEAAAGARLAKRHLFTPALLVTTADATVSRVQAWLDETARVAIEAGGADIFLTFSGHGRQKDFNSEPAGGPCNDDAYGLTEYWVLHGDFLADDVLGDFYRKLPRHSKVVVAADCCFGLGSAYIPLAIKRLHMEWALFRHYGFRSPAWNSRTAEAEAAPHASIVAIGSTYSGTLTKPGLITSLESAADGPVQSYASVIAKASEVFGRRHRGGSVSACRGGQDADSMWQEAFLS